jgi:predicted ATPase
VISGLPSGIVTFLFTDIEGSTRRWESDPEAMRIALEAHNKTLREAIELHGGQVFSYTGDGMCAVFTSPQAAADAAVDAQRNLQLPVRMGIGTGEAELRGGEYFGSVLNRTARVMAAGHGGQILLDGATAQLLSGTGLISLGARRLRDIANPVDIFQVRAANLRSDFPPLKTVDPVPGNLRPRNTTFVGRVSELAEVEEMLKTNRLVTLTGVGGVGKTRLATEVGWRLADEFGDGVWMIELAAVKDAAAVADAVATALGISQQPGMSVTASVASALAGRSRLLIFDNCEHVLDGAAEIIEAVLSRSRTVRILATSREGLRIEEEQLCPVASLDTHGGMTSSAASLFVERAHALTRGVALTPESAVIDICKRLDGIPLAIELAASRLLSMSVADIRDHLDDRFRLLVGSRRGLARHQTLRHAVQWSYDLLSEPEKSLLATCSVFANGFDLNALCAVSGSNDELATLDLLDSLVRKSLLTVNRIPSRTRYSMLETIRQFAEERLVASGRAANVHTAHARYFAGRESDIFALWDSPRQRETHSWLAAEFANLRAAFRWAADHDDLDTAATIAYYAGFVGFWGEQHEPIRWAEELVEPARAVQHPRLGQLYTMAALCYTAGRIEDAVAYGAAGRAVVRSGEFFEVHPEMEASLGGSSMATGEPQIFVDWCRDVIARRSPVPVHAQGCLALALKFAGADEEARVVSEDLVAAAETIRSPNLSAFVLFAYGMANRDNDPVRVYEVIRAGLPIAQASGSRQSEIGIAALLSYLATVHGDPIDAIDYLTQAVRYYHDAGSYFLIRSPLAFLVLLFDRIGYHRQAATIAGFADTPWTRSTAAEINAAIGRLREVLGDETYERLAHTGRMMTAAEMVTYAFDQMAAARSELLGEDTLKPPKFS